MIKQTLIVFIFFVSLINLNAQTFVVKGKVTNNSEALPFVTIAVKGPQNGVISNDLGNYEISLGKGTHTLVFQYVGFSKTEKVIELSKNLNLDVDLKSAGVSLNEVVVKAGEDPSYPIIRKAIKKRNYYNNLIEEYTCQSYIKGLQRLISVPEKFKKLVKLTTGEKFDSTQLGVIYLSESESNYYFKKPNLQKEIMFSSRVSGNNQAFSFNQLSQMQFNFNQNLISIGQISDRPIVSPLNKTAFLYYKFYLLDSLFEDGKKINKILVKPKRKTDPCFTGIIYIQDKTWRLTGADLRLTKDQKINFVDTLTIKQLHASVIGDSIWMPVNHNFSFSFKFMGIIGNGYFNASIKNYNLKPGLKKEFFSNELLVINDSANKKDSTYWLKNRPTPLTVEETKDYKKKDSIEKVESTDRYKDSVDHKRNRYRPNNFFTGYTYQITKKRFTVSLPGIITSGVQYNTVEGLNLSYNLSATKAYENNTKHVFDGRVRYGFSNFLWGGELGYNYFYNPKKFSRIGVRVKSIAEQYNQQDPIAPLVNSLYTLLMNENYMKLFKESGAEVNYFTELVNGVFLSANTKYVERAALKNTEDRLLIDNNTKLFTSNDPRNENNFDSLFTTNRAYTAEILFSFRFKQRFVTTPNEKIIVGSKYPRLVVGYKKAFPVFNTVADYDLATGSVSDVINMGLFGRLGYRVRGGAYVNTAKLFFMDFKYFLGNQTIFNTNDYLSSYRLLPYYTYSADKWFLEAHAEHHFNGFILNKLPLLKKLSTQEVAGIHFLSSNNLKDYYEINFGLENIFRVLRVDYVLGYGIENKVRHGFTIGINTRL